MLRYDTARTLILHEQYSLQFEYQPNIFLVFSAKTKQLYSMGGENTTATI